MERAEQTRREGRAFLQRTLSRQRAREAEEGRREREEMERRTQAVLSLKKNTENSEVCIHMLAYKSSLRP